MSLQAEPETFGINPEHCPCCRRAMKTCNIVVWRHLIGTHCGPWRHSDERPYDPEHCQCCAAVSHKIVALRREGRMFSGMWLTEQRHHLRAQQLLNAAIRLLPPGTKLPEDLERVVEEQARLDAAYRHDLERVTEQRDVLVEGLHAILWAIDGAPTDPVYASHIAPISNDEPLRDIAKALHKISDASLRALHRKPRSGKRTR
jgi:hypothetical protein